MVNAWKRMKMKWRVQITHWRGCWGNFPWGIHKCLFQPREPGSLGHPGSTKSAPPGTVCAVGPAVLELEAVWNGWRSCSEHSGGKWCWWQGSGCMSSCNHVNFLKVVPWFSWFLTETQTNKNTGCFSCKIDLLNPSISRELKFIMSRTTRSGDLIPKERWGEQEGILLQLAYCSTDSGAPGWWQCLATHRETIRLRNF